MNRLLLLDGNAILHRAFHALPPLTNAIGRQVNAVYGFASMVLKLEQDLRPYAIVATFDRPAPTFRKSLYENYQKTRPKMDETLSQQIPLVHELVESFGIPFYEKDGFEADDVIGTIVHTLTTGEWEKVSDSFIDQIIIVTGDRDILQLVIDDKVLVYMPTKGLSEAKLFSEKEVIAKMGVTPKQVIDLKALIGDSSDNYPGVAGIGPKTAVSLLEKEHSLQGVYEALEDHRLSASPSILEKLTKGKEAAYLSLQLATIRNDVPISISIPKMLPFRQITQARLFLESLQFHTLLGRMDGNSSQTKKQKPRHEKASNDSQQQSLF